VGNGFSSLEGVVMDSSGNFFVAELDFADAPSLSFATPTPVGSTDTTDGRQTVTIQNIGNAPLTFRPFVAGNLLDAVLTSPGSTDWTALSGLQLAAGAACTKLAL
jgi:hypothetical protein